jgi:hypothetical protein
VPGIALVLSGESERAVPLFAGYLALLESIESAPGLYQPLRWPRRRGGAGRSPPPPAAAACSRAKTVESHLGRVYRKLELRSRTEPADLLGREGELAEVAEPVRS